MSKQKEIVDLSKPEVAVVDILIYNAKQYVKTRMLYAVPIFVIASFIPLGILPKKRFRHNSLEHANIDQTQSMFEFLGITTWLLISVSMLIIAVLIMLSEKKYFALKKDQADLKKVKLTSVIEKKLSSPADDHYIMFVYDTDGKKIRIHVSEQQYYGYNVGDKIDFEILKNSKILL